MIAAAVGLLVVLLAQPASAAEQRSFFAYLQSERPAMIAYVPTGFDPRRPSAGSWPAERLRSDLLALRLAFNGLVLYDYRPEVTPGVLEQAAALGYHAVLLGIWDPRAEAEISGTAELVRGWSDRLALAVVIGNEGINDNRYTIGDLERARERLRAGLGPAAPTLPISTSEPAGDYGWPPLLAFGDFLAPNIHPAIDQAALAPEAAVSWVHGRAEAIAGTARRPVLVKETGLPNGGGEIFSPERQHAFWTAWLARGRVTKINGQFISYAAAFEAFDAPWKSEQLQSPLEGHWGLMNGERRPYPAFTAWREAAAAR